jgi:hypothetical protein
VLDTEFVHSITKISKKPIIIVGMDVSNFSLGYVNLLSIYVVCIFNMLLKLQNRNRIDKHDHFLIYVVFQ